MAMEVKIRNSDGKMEYLDEVTMIEKGGNELFLFFDSEETTTGEKMADLMTGNAERYEDAQIETVKEEGEKSIKELEERDWKEQEEIIEQMWENPEIPRNDKWDDIDSLKEAKAKFKRLTFDEESED